MDHDKDPIIVFTPYTFEQMKAFHRHAYRKIRTLFLILAILIVWYAIQVLIEGIETSALYRMLEENTLSIAPVIFLILFVAFMGLMSFGLMYTRRRHDETNMRNKNGQTYYFRNDQYEAETNNNGADVKSVYTYDTIKRVEETKEMFYMFTGKNAAVLADKKQFKSGSYEDFRLLLRRHVPPRRFSFLY